MAGKAPQPVTRAAVAAVPPMFAGRAPTMPVAGTSLGPSGTIDAESRVRAGTTSAAGGTPTLHTLSGTQNQNVSALDGNARGDAALVTRRGTSRMVFLRRHGSSTFSRILTIAVTSQARDMSVALARSRGILRPGPVKGAARDGPLVCMHAMLTVGGMGRKGAACIRRGGGRLPVKRPATAWDGRRDAGRLHPCLAPLPLPPIRCTSKV